jgi:hypothetical protein
MKKHDENWALDFIPECFFDTVILKKLLETNKNVRHIKGCENVMNAFKRKELIDSFAVALVDKDKRELDYLKECEVIRKEDKFFVWKHKSKPHFIIQITPPIEKWIVEILNENGLSIENFGYPNDYKRLKKSIKYDIDSESDEKLNKLVNAIINTKCETVTKLKAILQYLKRQKEIKNYEVDINELKNV